MLKASILLLGLLISSAAQADDCIKGLTKFNVCKEARQIADELAEMLPMKLSKNISWESVMAVKGSLLAHYRLSYDLAHLKSKYAEAGMKIEDAKKALAKQAYNVCNQDSSAKSFVNLGGKLIYIYSFVDGERFTEVTISSCD